jgi:hypothetical protein
MATQIVPKIFDRIELGGVGRQSNQAYIGRHFESSAGVIAGAVPDQDRLYAWCDRCRELSEKGIDRIRIEIRRKNPLSLACRWACSSDHVQIAVLCLPYRPRARAAFSPHASQRALLTKPRFILEEDLDLFLRMGLADGGELIGQVAFLKSSCRAASAFT